MKHVRIGIIGYGNLGKSMVKLLHTKQKFLREHEGLDLELTCVLGRNGGVRVHGLEYDALMNVSRLNELPDFDVNFNLAKMLDGDLVDVVAEFTPTNKLTGEPGLTHIRECLKNNIHVTTGNKGPIAIAWDELSSLAREKNLLLGISCTTGGAMPALLSGTDALAGSSVLSVEGILNGTTNFILEQMEREGTTYESALRAAQEFGIAEANPSQDVEGWDTAVKILIIARVVMGAKLKLDDLRVRGITGITPEDIKRERDNGARIKLVGQARRVSDDGEVVCEVAPMVVTPDNPLYNISGKTKAVRYMSDTMGELFVAGGASDPMASAASALRDVVSAHRAGLL